MIGVVIDTNVIISANLKPEGLEAKVLRWVLNQKARLYVSEPILEEYKKVLYYSKFKFVPEQIEDLFRLLNKVSSVVVPKRQLNECVDVDDNKFLECAEATAAQFIITGNKKHFPAFWKTTKIINAREFLNIMIFDKL